jgi:hypothetical protein
MNCNSYKLAFLLGTKLFFGYYKVSLVQVTNELELLIDGDVQKETCIH